jgi:hypothetical protein
MRFCLSGRRLRPNTGSKAHKVWLLFWISLKALKHPPVRGNQKSSGPVSDYDPAWLDALCLSGRLTWLRLSPPRLSPEKANSSAGAQHANCASESK